MDRTNRFYKIFITSMIVAIAVMLLASGIIALSKSMKLNMSINITPNFKLEVCINEVNNVIFRNFADETTGKTIEVKNGISGIQGSNLIVDDKAFKDYGNEFTLIIINYTTTTGIEVEMTSTATMTGGGIGVPAEIESSKYIATQYSTGDADYVSFSVAVNSVFPQTTMLKINILECSDFMIQYDLDGGTNNEDNPTRYSTGNHIGLEVPTREGYEFVGWTGSNGTTPELLVDVEQGSTGHKTYTANWLEMQDYTLLTGSSFNSKIVSNATSITFDKYSKYARSFPDWAQGVAVDVDEVGNIKVFSDGTDIYVLSKGYINANPDASQMFNCFLSCETIDFSNFDTSNVIDMGEMFFNCRSLTRLDLSGFDTSNVTDMNYMFCECNNLIHLDVSGFDTSNVTDIGYMFPYGMVDLDFIKNLDISNIENIDGLFRGYQGESLSFLSDWDVSNVTFMSYMFAHCSVDLSFLSAWDVSNVEWMDGMFEGYQGESLNFLSDWDVSNVASMSYMFAHCSVDLSFLSAWADKLSNVGDMSSMFEGYQGESLSFLSDWDVSNVACMNEMFAGCSAGTINLSGCYVSDAFLVVGMFGGCTATEITLSGWDVSNMNMDELIYMFYDEYYEECFCSVGTLYISGWILPEGYEAEYLAAAFESIEGIENVVVS